MIKTRPTTTLFAALCVLAALVSAGCSVNPATGQRQLNLYSEAQEIAMGRQYAEQVGQSIGLYPNEALQEYVHRIGTELAASSERPHLPWSFQVVDDPAVNAFALPGGFIFITRGLLGHMGSEAELSGVLGHEIGHVTARHSVNQMSKQQLAQIGLFGAAVANPDEFRRYGQIASQGLGVLFLKFGRDDERQADALGFDYMQNIGYPPAALGELFNTLGRVSASAGGGRLPGWLSTHPYPEDRAAWVRQAMQSVTPDQAAAPWKREPYLDLIDGMTYGPNPREGFFRGEAFYHPDLNFEMEGPRGWKGINQKHAVAWQSPQQDALFVLSLTGERSVRNALNTFYIEQKGIQPLDRFPVRYQRLEAVASVFETTPENHVRGAVAFVEYDDRVYRLIGYSRSETWRGIQQNIAQAMSSFSRLRNRRDQEVEPMRISLVAIHRDMSLREFDQQYPSSVDLKELAIVNQTEVDGQLRAGSLVKRIRGFNPKTDR